MSFGATKEAWDHFDLVLGLTADLLPVVSNPGATIAPTSALTTTGKVPSLYTSQRQVMGILSWTSRQTTGEQVSAWSGQDDYGICLQTRAVRAIDVDISEDIEASEVRKLLAPYGLPVRTRNNSSKFLLLFYLKGDLPKRTVKTKHGMIEMLGTGQQCVVAGTHPSGSRYEWLDGLPTHIPEWTLEQFETVWATLVKAFAVEASITSKTSSKTTVLSEAINRDPVAQHLVSKGTVLSIERDGRMHITCPFADQHTTAGASSATTYFPANTGGYATGNIKCLHAHCSGRTQQDFLHALGLSDFTDLHGVPEKGEGWLIPADAFCDKPAPIRWLVRGLIQREALIMVHGPSGGGKTFFVLDMVCHIAAFLPHYYGRPIHGTPVVYLAGEGHQGLKGRLAAWRKHNKVQKLNMWVSRSGTAINTPEGYTHAHAALTALGVKPGCIVVDTLHRHMGGDENSAQDTKTMLDACAGLMRDFESSVVLVHHTGVSEGTQHRARGSSAWRGALEIEMSVAPGKAEGLVEIISRKAKDTELQPPFTLRITSVVLDEWGVDEDGLPITSAVMTEAVEVEALKDA